MEIKYYDQFSKIDSLIKIYSSDNFIKLEDYIKDKTNEDYFFKKLASSPNPFPWLIPLKKKGYFNPKNNPRPHVTGKENQFFTLSYWNVMDFLENVANKNKENPSDDITNTLVEIIDPIIDYKDENGKRIENYYTDYSMVKIIFSLPVERIGDEYFEFLETAFRSNRNTSLIISEINKTILSDLINKRAKDLILKLLNVILDYRKVGEESLSDTKERFNYYFITDQSSLYFLLKKYKKAIAELCDIEAAEIALNKVETIVEEDPSQFNFIWIPTVEDNPVNSFPGRYDCQMVFFIRDMLEHADPTKIKGKVKSLFFAKHDIFKRIAIYLINYHYDILQDLFWEIKDNPLQNYALKHELYEFFKARSVSFNRKQIGRIIEWIESAQYIPKERKGDSEQDTKYIALRKKEWLLSLLPSKNPDVSRAYEKYKRINPEEPNHPGMGPVFEISEGYESPVEKAEIISKSNEELAKFLTEYTATYKTHPRADEEGLAHVLRECVAETPRKFTENMSHFTSVPRIYQHALLFGIYEAQRLQKPIEWDRVLDFMQKLMSDKSFGKVESQGSKYRDWIVSVMADIIDEGTKNQKNAITSALLPKAKKLLLRLLQFTTPSDSYPDDLIMTVLNSNLGKIYTAMIHLNFRYAVENDNKWMDGIKNALETRLKPPDPEDREFHFVLGANLISLYNFDTSWILNHKKMIFPENNEDIWTVAFSGYLAYTPRLFRPVYHLLRDDYNRAIRADFKNTIINDKLVQHICIMYLYEWESLDNDKSLIVLLLENQNVRQLMEIIRFFWSQTEFLIPNDKNRAKVKPLWKRIIDIAKRYEKKKEFQEVFAALAKWLHLVETIDNEIYEWLKLSATFMSENMDSTLFIEYLTHHASESPERVGNIYLEMLNTGILPLYPSENIREIVRALYTGKQQEIADRICNKYGSKGYEFLRDIYEES